MHGPARNAAPPAGPRYNRHLAEQPRPAAAVDPFASGSDGADGTPDVGPVFTARYDSECAWTNCRFHGVIEEGDDIRASEGDYFHEECWEDYASA